MSSVPRLPRVLEAHEDHDRVRKYIASSLQPLRPGSRVDTVSVPLDESLMRSLRTASLSRRLVRGLENAEAQLRLEARGMDKVDRQTGVTRGARISRLILIANDGAPGFYSSLEKLHRVHGDRLLVITLDVDARTLGESLYGHGAVARALLVEHKDAVAAILLGLTWDDGSDI